MAAQIAKPLPKRLGFYYRVTLEHRLVVVARTKREAVQKAREAAKSFKLRVAYAERIP
jgi:hypothetical protein